MNLQLCKSILIISIMLLSLHGLKGQIRYEIGMSYSISNSNNQDWFYQDLIFLKNRGFSFYPSLNFNAQKLVINSKFFISANINFSKPKFRNLNVKFTPTFIDYMNYNSLGVDLSLVPNKMSKLVFKWGISYSRIWNINGYDDQMILNYKYSSKNSISALLGFRYLLSRFSFDVNVGIGKSAWTQFIYTSIDSINFYNFGINYSILKNK